MFGVSVVGRQNEWICLCTLFGEAVFFFSVSCLCLCQCWQAQFHSQPWLDSLPKLLLESIKALRCRTYYLRPSTLRILTPLDPYIKKINVLIYILQRKYELPMMHDSAFKATHLTWHVHVIVGKREQILEIPTICRISRWVLQFDKKGLLKQCVDASSSVLSIRGEMLHYSIWDLG